MASKSQPGSQPDSSPANRLPFEPAKSRKKPAKQPAAAPTSAKPDSSRASDRSAAIPEVVSKRMVRRMAIFCGIPTIFGLSSFFVSYLIVSRELFDLPPSAVLLVSLGFFGLGVVGLSYGVLSASWDENEPGSVLGWSEFTTNLGRMTGAWRSTKQQ